MSCLASSPRAHHTLNGLGESYSDVVCFRVRMTRGMGVCTTVVFQEYTYMYLYLSSLKLSSLVFFSFCLHMVLPHNMAAILAVASMKEQLKLNNSNSLEVSPSVTITPSRLSPNLNTENSNNSNSGKRVEEHMMYVPRYL